MSTLRDHGFNGLGVGLRICIFKGPQVMLMGSQNRITEQGEGTGRERCGVEHREPTEPAPKGLRVQHVPLADQAGGHASWWLMGLEQPADPWAALAQEMCATQTSQVMQTVQPAS